MNTIRKKFSKTPLLALFAAIFMVSCSSPKTMSSALQKIKIKADPQNLQVDGDSVTIKISGRFPAKMFVKNAAVKFQPTLQYGDQKKVLASKYFVGEKIMHLASAAKISFDRGGRFTYYQRLKYTPEMRESMLTIDYTVKFASKREELSRYASGTMKDSILGSATLKPTDARAQVPVMHSVSRIGQRKKKGSI